MPVMTSALADRTVSNPVVGSEQQVEASVTLQISYKKLKAIRVIACKTVICILFRT